MFSNLYLSGMPIHIATKKHQNKKHHKRRINKKWAKRYGVTEYDMVPPGKPIIIDGVLYITQKDFDLLKKEIAYGSN